MPELRQGQLIDWGKSWILAQHAGRPLTAVYLNRDGKQLRDATSKRVVKALGVHNKSKVDMNIHSYTI